MCSIFAPLAVDMHDRTVIGETHVGGVGAQQFLRAQARQQRGVAGEPRPASKHGNWHSDALRRNALGRLAYPPTLIAGPAGTTRAI